MPWYNLVELHQLLKKDIEDRGGIIDTSYTAVFLDALRHGPETDERLAARLEARRAMALSNGERRGSHAASVGERGSAEPV